MVLFMHYLTYKVLVLYSSIAFINFYGFMDFLGVLFAGNDSPIALIFYIHILLIGYILVEAKSDWSLFPRYRNILIYGISLILTIQALIGLDIIRRYGPNNPEQVNRTDFLYDAILRNDLSEVKRLITKGYDPFDFSYGNTNIFDNYIKFFFAYRLTSEEWNDRKELLFGDNPSQIFHFASVSGIEKIRRWKVIDLRQNYLHPHELKAFPSFDSRIFNYLLSLNPPQKTLQNAISDLIWQGNTIALQKILDYDKSLSPTLRDIYGSIRRCDVDISEILLERYFKNLNKTADTYRLFHEEFDSYRNDFSPCTVPIRKYLETKKNALP
ncbi:hypothetical protein MNBD_ALPHA02-1345 [hydrothermal vent metagenome]|uniref:Uncharacterized protein n=1 Tax=hydrothermal vent metagenome TaxID=652676 RepID=A0A3B0S6K8_9ZZZZ